MDEQKRLLLANRAWVKEKLDLRPDFFEMSMDSQSPEFLWIGCADSRVPAEEITGAGSGELFVHRNIANLVVHTDFSAMGVIQYAVQVLKVKHIIICGHYNCGGVKTAMSHQNVGLLNKWLRHIKDVYRFHAKELDVIEDEKKRLDRLVELNVLEQTYNLAQTSYIQECWSMELRPQIHGWVYDLRNGLLKEVISLKPGDPIDDIYRYDLTISSDNQKVIPIIKSNS
jgi:carbonic anhydrase